MSIFFLCADKLSLSAEKCFFKGKEMNMKKNEAIKNKGFYIAVCCCVSVIAIIGYVSWFTSRTQIKSQNDFSYKEDLSDISEVATVPAEKEVIAPERKIVPVKDKPFPASKNVITDDTTPEFIKPIDGEVIGEFSGEILIFSEKLSDWRTHDGIDIRAKEGENVLSSADGVIEKIYSGSMGNSIVIDHSNGYKTVYSNLADFEDDPTGQSVKKGDKIGKTGNSAISDLSNEGHLHFEILKDELPVNPMDFIK